MRHATRPDGRCFVFGEPDDDLPAGRLYATVEGGDAERQQSLARLGFTPHRRELLLELPTDPSAWSVREVAPPPGVAFERADRVQEERLRRLDDLLRQDVPGTDGWEWSAEEFREETYDSPQFDPATYLIAVGRDGEYLGIARVWMRPEQPRLGFVGVRADCRRRGLARALLAAVLGQLHEREVHYVRTDVDELNTASRRLLAGFGGKPVGSVLELVREGS